MGMNGCQEVKISQNDAQSVDLPIGIEKEETKQCTECKRILPRSKFRYSLDNRTNKRYITSRCIECLKKYSRERWERHAEIKRRAAMEYHKKYPERLRESRRRSYQKNKEKILADNRDRKDLAEQRAQAALRRAVDRGEIIRPDKCEICGKTNFEIIGHHEDYSKPFEAAWCCKSCHSQIHVGKSEDFKCKYSQFLVTKRARWVYEETLRKLKKQQQKEKQQKEQKTPITIRLNKDEHSFLHGIKNKWGCEMSAYVCRLIERDFSKNSKDICWCENIVRMVSLLPKQESTQKYFRLVTLKDQYEKLEKTKYITGVRFSDYIRSLLRSRI